MGSDPPTFFLWVREAVRLNSFLDFLGVIRLRFITAFSEVSQPSYIK